MLLYLPVYSDFSVDTDAPTAIDKSFIQSEMDDIDAQVQDLDYDIDGLNLSKEALNAQISIMQNQRLLDDLTARRNDLNSKTPALGTKKKRTKDRDALVNKLALLNKEIAIRNEMIALYKLQLADDENSQEVRTGNLVYIQAQIKLREDEITALSGTDADGRTMNAAAAATPDAAAQALLDKIKNIDARISVDRQKIDDLKKQEAPLEIQLKGM
jgi:hypothetical protein